MSFDQECIDLKISDTVMTSQKGIKLEGANARRVLNIPSKRSLYVSHAQLAHFSTLAKEKHILLILNFSTLTFITNARTTMPFARLHSQMEWQLHLGFVHSLMAKLKTEMCKSHRLGSAKTNTGHFDY